MRNENVYIIHDSAENVNCYVEGYKIQKIHYIVSGLPFASLPFKVSKNSLQQTKTFLEKKELLLHFNMQN